MQTSWQPGPARPRLDADTVDVWLVALDCALPLDPLSEGERERAARFVRDGDGRRWAAARTALRLLLAGYAEADPHALRFEEGPHGKPAFATDAGVAASGLRFNLSHSGDLALIAVARDRELGIDVELPRRPIDHVAIARRVLGAEEAEGLGALADPRERERAFLRAWVRWEAVLKCRGTGIGGAEEPSSGPDPWVTQLELAPPAAAALATADGPCTVRCWSWPPTVA
jgi:4'-phosphopantetheinyl transferase